MTGYYLTSFTSFMIQEQDELFLQYILNMKAMRSQSVKEITQTTQGNYTSK